MPNPSLVPIQEPPETKLRRLDLPPPARDGPEIPSMDVLRRAMRPFTELWIQRKRITTKNGLDLLAQCISNSNDYFRCVRHVTSTPEFYFLRASSPNAHCAGHHANPNSNLSLQSHRAKRSNARSYMPPNSIATSTGPRDAA